MGDRTINGTNGNNSATVRAPIDGSTGRPSTVPGDLTVSMANGATAVNTGSRAIYQVTMGDGADTLIAENMSGAYLGGSSTGSWRNTFDTIDMGAGNDYVFFNRSAAGSSINMGTGEDTLNFQNSYAQHINMGDGNDKLIAGPNDETVSAQELSAKNNAPDMEIDGGAGNDTLNLMGEWTLTLTNGSNVTLDTDGTVDGLGGTVVQHTLGWQDADKVWQYPANFSGSVNWAPVVSGTVTVTPKGIFRNFEGVKAVCFTAGTMIETPNGSVRIETLKAGDLVITQNGVKPVSWIGKRRMDVVDLGGNPKMLPIRIPAGALGNGLPTADISFSPQHRVLVRSAIAQQMFGAAEVLVPVKHLVGYEGIEVVTDLAEVVYVHLMFDEHTTVEVCGIEAETMYPGVEAFRMVSVDALDELRAIFHDVDAVLAGDVVKESCLPMIKGRDARALAARHAKNNLPLYAV